MTRAEQLLLDLIRAGYVALDPFLRWNPPPEPHEGLMRRVRKLQPELRALVANVNRKDWTTGRSRRGGAVVDPAQRYAPELALAISSMAEEQAKGAAA